MITFTHCAFMAKQACATFSQVVQKITPPSANNFLKFFFALFAMLALGVGNAWGAEETITFEYDGSDVITKNTYSTTYALHRWTATSTDGTIIYAGGKTSNANGGSAWGLRYASNRVGEVIGNIEPSYDASTSWKTKIPSGAVGAIPGNIKQIKVYFHNATSGTRGCYILVSKNQIYADDLVPNTTPSGATKSSKLTSNNYTTTPASQTYETSNGYKYFGVVSANSSFIGIKSIVITYETAGSSEETAYSVKVTQPAEGGTIEADKDEATKGATITLTATPDEGYKFGAWDVEDADKNSITVSNNQFTMPESDVTVTASFVAKTQYTISWSVNGATKTLTPANVYEGDALGTLPTPDPSDICTDKVFVGWTTEANKDYKHATDAPEFITKDTKPSANTTYYAVFAIKGEDQTTSIAGGDWSNGVTGGNWSTSGTDTYSSNGVKFDDANDYVMSPDISSNAYTRLLLKFKSGHNGGEGSVLKFYAYNKNSEQLTGDDITISPETVVPTETYTQQNTTYQVNISANEVIGKIMIRMDSKTKNLGMKYCELFGVSSSHKNYTTKCAQTYTVTFNANGHGTAPTTQNVEENGKASKPTDPSAAGYTFGGWYKEAECTNAWDFENDEVTGDITLYAKWTAETYTITLDANGGKFVQDGTESTTIEIKYTHGTYASYDAAQLISEYLEEKGITLSREGYQLNEMWQSNGSSWKRVFTAINRTITAQWSKLYTITLSENGKETTPTTQTATSYTLPTVLSAGSCKDDTKEFVGWTTNQDLSSETTPTSDFYKKGETVTLSEDKTTFYAVFATPKTNPGEMVEEEVTAAVNISSYATANGWTNGEKYETVNIDDNITAIASGGTYTGCYYTSGHEWRLYQTESATLTISAENNLNINTVKVTYNISNKGVLKHSGSNVTSGTVKRVNASSITFSVGNSSTETNGQVKVTSMEVTYTTTVQADDIVTYSNYSTKCVPTYKITYDFAGGDGECTTDIVEKGSEYTLCSTAPTRAGHEFLNWKDQHGTKKYAAGATINSVTEDLTLTAQWQVNSYEVTWMSLGSKLSSSKVNYNAQPTKPATNPTYLCGTDKEFVGWTTQEIEGVGTPANLYTNDFPAVTADVTYHAVFATKSEDGGSLAKATSLTSGETVYLATESGIGVMGANTETNKDAAVSTTQSDWMAFTVVANGEQYQFKNGENYISAAAKSFKITATPSDFTFENSYIVYNVSTGSDAGNYVLLYNSNSGSFYRFYKISNMGKENYETFYIYKSNPTHTDYVTSCEEVGSDMSNSTKVITPSVESGIFSVGDGKYVQFSTGNLQYEVGTNTWSFASEQYEVIGGAAYDPANPTNTNYGMNEPGYTGKLDLFAWSSDGKFGVNPSNTDDDYVATDFEDWGELVNETGWYTLTKDEMNYILNRKKDGKKLWALATVCGMNGLILLPDNWNTSTTLEYGYIPTDWNYTKNQLDAAAWATLEAAGAVFLPEGGTRVGGHGNKEQGGGPAEFDTDGDYFHVDNVGEMGYYWLNTQDARDDYENCASFLILPGWNDNGTPANEDDDKALAPQVWSREKRRGNSVRLVKAIEPNYTRDKQSAGVYGTVCYPENIVWCDGATLYEVAGREGNKVIFDEVTAPEAGMPYIFIANQENLYFFCGTDVAATADKKNSLQGTFTQIEDGAEGAYGNILEGNYVLYNNIIKKCGAYCGLYANRAYFVADDLENMDKAPAAAPGRRRISLDVTSENTTTGLDNITNGENTTVKIIENGQLIIIRNGEKFNAQGQKL